MDHILIVYSIEIEMAGQTVCRRGIETVPGEETVGGIGNDDIAVEEHGAAIAVGSAKFDIMG